MREVSVRMVLLLADLARAGEIAEGVVTAELASLQPRDGKLPKYVDWDDFIEATERLERLLGGPEAFARVVRSVLPTAYPELRSFAAIFLRPIPLFSFVMTRLNRANYRNLEMNVERVGEDRVRWRETIPEPFRPSATFHRMTKQLTEIFPCLDLPEARVEMRNMTPRVADFDAVFPARAESRDRQRERGLSREHGPRYAAGGRVCAHRRRVATPRRQRRGTRPRPRPGARQRVGREARALPTTAGGVRAPPRRPRQQGDRFRARVLAAQRRVPRRPHHASRAARRKT